MAHESAALHGTSKLHAAIMMDRRREDPGPKPQKNKHSDGTSSQHIAQPSSTSDDESPRPTLVIASPSKGWKITSNRIIAAFTVVIGVAAVAQGINAYLQWDIMKKQLDLSQRPWIGKEFERNITFTWNQDRWEAYLSGVSTNHGGSPALNVLQWVQVFPLDKTQQFGPAKDGQQQWCGKNRAPQQGFVTGDVLLPKQEVDTKHYFTIHEKDLSETTIGLAMVGCVVYRASYDPPEQPTRQTRFSYMLMDILRSKEPITFNLVKLPALSSAD